MYNLKKNLTLGEGTYGTVYQASVMVKNQEVAQKVAVKRLYCDKPIFGISSIKELDILNNLKGHPFISDLLGVGFGNPFTHGKPMSPICPRRARNSRDDQIHLILDLSDMCCADLIVDRKKCTPEKIKVLYCQFLLGLEYIHRRNITHRDLKPANLLVSNLDQDSINLKICDFGMSQRLNGSAPSTPNVCTSWYRAPEICCGHQNYNIQSDMWSAGCIGFEFCSGLPLLNLVRDEDTSIFNTALSKLPTQLDRSEIVRFTAGGKVKITAVAQPFRRSSFLDQMKLSKTFIDQFNSTTGSIEEFDDLITRMLVVDPDKRIDVTSALEHKFFDGFRDFITSVRKKYQPSVPSLSILTIVNCIERKWMIRTAFSLYNKSQTLDWYEHRQLFHAIEIFDRYLEYSFNPNNRVELRKIETKQAGRLMTPKETECKFYLCLYMVHKYYSTINFPLDWNSFAPAEFHSFDYLNMAEQFELHLLRDVTNYNIFQDTLLEIADQFNHKLTEELINKLLHQYGTIVSWENQSVRALYRKILAINKS